MIAYQNLSGFTEIWYQGRQVQEVYSNTSKVWPTNIKFSATYIGGQTYSTECNGDTELSLSETKPSGYEYSAMTTAEIGDCVTSIGMSVFYWCKSLTSVTIPNSVTSIGDSAFARCTGLTSIDIPDSVTSIGDGAFGGCTGLTSITCNATTPPTLESQVFDGSTCPIYVPCQSLEAYKTAWSTYASRIQCIEPTFDGKFKATYGSSGKTYEKECDGNPTLTSGDTNGRGLYDYTTMTSAEIGDCVTTISGNAFNNFSSLASVTIGNNLAYIRNKAFISCDRLSSINFPDSLISIGIEAFADCRSLTSVTIPNSVTIIGQTAFYYCTSLTSCTIGSSVASIGSDAFYYCRILTSITVNATKPPILGSRAFDNTNNCPIYVPAASVEAYKTASSWSNYASRIQAIP